MTLSVTDGRERWRCRKNTCRQDIQLRSNTWLENSRLGFDKVLLFIYCWSHKLTSVDFCERKLKINHNTIVDWNNYLREVCAAKLLANPLVIGGPGLTVEIDESVFAKRKYNVGRVPKKQWIFGGICHETKDCFLFAVEDRSAASLMPIIVERIAPGTRIVSDKWRSYNGIRNANSNYDHNTVNHSENFIDPETGAHTNTVKRMWGVAKSSFRRQYGTHSKLLDSYLCEFMWRKRLTEGTNPFEAILQDIAAFWPPQSKKNVWVSSGFSNLAGLINSAKSHELSGVHAINVSKMAEFEQKRLNGTCDVMDNEEGRGEVFIKTETETDFVVSYDDPLRNVTDICEENSPTCQNMPPDKKRKSFSSPIPPCSLNAGFKTVYPSGSSANLETEFDLWARSVAHQLNNMDLKTALQLQLKMQQLLTEDRISQD
ncbi:uncharacterized protein LOC124356778 isoform X2 [Homalodisca vitripennis]|uniref:uncharacterized protein LOC124356778 isoform X2 n=1 Tax=Homalodisca vitripennis TaxID=197043 RepID=UPI001EEC90B7|nr:uncharacterized protein LOC124356778 isoform X2 [Homalodisca vitripennis]